MIAVLRFIGVFNAAVWFGAVLFFTVSVAPTVFAPELKWIFGQAHTGLVAQALLGALYVTQYWCGGIALLHQLAEWVYLGKPLHRFTFSLLIFICGVNLLGGLVLQPKMKAWHNMKYSSELFRRELYPPEQKKNAERLFGVWHRVSLTFHLVTIGGLGYYLWRTAVQVNGPRFVAAGKFRG